MGELTLVIGTRNYSSWSLRPWLLLRHLGIPFSERLVHLDTPQFAADVPQLSPTARVPVLLHDGLVIWESLAICEYLVELAGGRGWPADRAARARARAVAAEIHSGLAALRAACPMNARASGRRVPMTPALARDVARVDALWCECRERHAGEGPWLFGGYSAADAMYGPVVLRFRTYDLPLSPAATVYLDTVLADGAMAEWVAAATVEGVIVAADEAGQPG